MKLLAISNLFPNAFEPRRGAFNVGLFKALAHRVSVEVVAPIPYYPGMRWLGARAAFGRVGGVAWREEREGLTVYHPRYVSVPKIGRSLYAGFYKRGIRSTIARLRETFAFDGIVASWVYPDGVGAEGLARELDVPIVIKADGTDINQTMQHRARRRMIVRALNGSLRVVAVSGALADIMTRHGVDPERITVLHNGVDRDVFRPLERTEACIRLGLDTEVKRILFVGNLVPVKGLEYLLGAMERLSARDAQAHLHVVGFGPQREAVTARIAHGPLRGRVHLEGEVKHADVALWMNAAHVLCLPSLSEGSPTVVSESLACGLPVVASCVGGVPEVVCSESYGVLVPPTDTEALAIALSFSLRKTWDREAICQHGSQYTWERNAEAIVGFFEAKLCATTARGV